jgi:hypothetical protein
MGSYWTRPEWLPASNRLAKVAISRRLKTLCRLYLHDTLFKGLTQHLQDMSAELRQFIQQEHAMMCQRDLARHRDLAAPDQPDIGDGVLPLLCALETSGMALRYQQHGPAGHLTSERRVPSPPRGWPHFHHAFPLRYLVSTMRVFRTWQQFVHSLI